MAKRKRKKVFKVFDAIYGCGQTFMYIAMSVILK